MLEKHDTGNIQYCATGPVQVTLKEAVAQVLMPIPDFLAFSIWLR